VGITAFPFTAVIDVPTARILGRDDAGTGAAEALTNTEIFAILGTGTPSASTYLRGDGTWATVSGGISSLNGLTDATQTFAVGTTGTNVAFSSAAGVHTLNIPDASATARGVVTTGAQTIAGAKTLTGVITANGGSQNGAGLRLNNIQFGPYGENNGWNFVFQSGSSFRISASGIVLQSNRVLAWGNSFNNTGTTQLWEDASHRLAQRNGVNPQWWGLYNTYTSDTSFERLDIAWASNVCTVEVTAGSAGGTLRGLRIGGASTSLLGFYGATPVDRPDTIADPAGGGTIDAEARTAINTIIDRLQELGLIA
jgi:hypothetical protein